MGIRFICPSCDKKLNVKSYLGGKRGICPKCDARIRIPTESEVGERYSTLAELAGDKPRVPMSVEQCVAERPDLKWYVRPAEGGEFGPASGEILHSWIAERRIDHRTQVRRHDWIYWQTASTIFSEFNKDDLAEQSNSVDQQNGTALEQTSAVAVLERPQQNQQILESSEPFEDDSFFIALETDSTTIVPSGSFTNLQVEESTLAHHNIRRSDRNSNKLKSLVLATLSLVLLGSLVAVVILSQ